MNRLLFVLLLLFGSARLLTAQPANSLYLDQYVQPLDLEDDSLYRSFGLLDETVGQYRFFFTAEQHWKTINTQIQLRFLLYLHQKAGVRTLILEGGYAYGYLINTYLKTGDKGLLRKALTDIPVCPDDQEFMFESLYAYNQKLPLEERIQVCGIDLEHSPELALQVMNDLQTKQEPPAAIAKRVQQIRDLHHSRYYDRREVKRFFHSLNKDIRRKEDLYRTYWGTDFDRMQLLVENTLAGYQFGLIKAMIIRKTWQKREERLFQNFLTIKPYLPEGGYYAQFGALHTDIKESFRWEFPSLAHRLNYYTDSPVASQVLTIGRYLRKMGGQYEQLAESEALNQLVDHVSETFPDQVVLCNLMAPGSPFQTLQENAQFMLMIDPQLEEESCD